MHLSVLIIIYGPRSSRRAIIAIELSVKLLVKNSVCRWEGGG